MLSTIWKFILETIAPITCVSCGKHGQHLCSICQSNLPIAKQFCIVCGKISLLGITHNKCKIKKDPYGVLAIFEYKNPSITKLIIRGKYYFIPDCYLTLGSALCEYLKQQHLEIYFKNYILCPIPLSKARERWRGFNQSKIIAQVIADKLNLQIEPALVRTRWTKTQKNLKQAARQKNVSGCFALNNHVSVSGKSILLIDDVVTTGATLREATLSLKQAGAKNVWCLAVARD